MLYYSTTGYDSSRQTSCFFKKLYDLKVLYKKLFELTDLFSNSERIFSVPTVAVGRLRLRTYEKLASNFTRAVWTVS